MAIIITCSLRLTRVTPTAWESQEIFLEENKNPKHYHFLALTQEKDKTTADTQVRAITAAVALQAGKKTGMPIPTRSCIKKVLLFFMEV